jgi:hypothetical protein
MLLPTFVWNEAALLQDALRERPWHDVRMHAQRMQRTPLQCACMRSACSAVACACCKPCKLAVALLCEARCLVRVPALGAAACARLVVPCVCCWDA